MYSKENEWEDLSPMEYLVTPDSSFQLVVKMIYQVIGYGMVATGCCLDVVSVQEMHKVCPWFLLKLLTLHMVSYHHD